MSLKIEDKVRMTKQGFKFYSNLDCIFHIHSGSSKIDSEHFTSAICSLMAVHGVGTVKRFNHENDPYIKWEFRLDGIRYYYCHYYQLKDVKKLTFLDKLIFKLQGRI